MHLTRRISKGVIAYLRSMSLVAPCLLGKVPGFRLKKGSWSNTSTSQKDGKHLVTNQMQQRIRNFAPKNQLQTETTLRKDHGFTTTKDCESLVQLAWRPQQSFLVCCDSFLHWKTLDLTLPPFNLRLWTPGAESAGSDVPSSMMCMGKIWTSLLLRRKWLGRYYQINPWYQHVLSPQMKLFDLFFCALWASISSYQQFPFALMLLHKQPCFSCSIDLCIVTFWLLIHHHEPLEFQAINQSLPYTWLG